MKKYLILTLLLMSFNLLAKGGDLVNNGGGIAERNVLFAYTNLEFSIGLCLDLESCHLSNREHSILKDIYSHLDEEKKNQNQIVFISELKYPGTFIIDGEMKAAATGSTIGSVIRVNTDLLYSIKEHEQIEALSVHEATAMLVHELGHHYGSFTHTELDLLGIKVSQHLNKSTYQTPLLPNGSSISAIFINGKEGTSFPEAILYGHQQMINISEFLKKQVSCELFGLPIKIGSLPPIAIPIKRPNAFLVNNVYWSEMPRRNNGVFKIKGSLTNYCDKEELNLNLNRNYKFEIAFTINHTDDKNIENWSINENSIKIMQIEEPWLRILEFQVN